MIPSPDIYTDFQSLTRLRAQARENSPEALRAVAKQFEGIFLQMMLKGMREANLGDGIMDSDQTEFYQGMFDQQLSATLSQGRGLGLADMLVKQLGGNLAATAKNNDKNISGLPTPHDLPEAAMAPSPSSFGSPEEFVKSLLPHAQQAGKELGVAPAALLAQAALESGWGQSVMRHPDGRSSHNLFGIKADGRWQGERLVMPTLEYADGKAGRRNEAFRSYDSFSASFSDYANFLRANPRYGQALAVAGDPQAFAEALQNAGYATDPAYARKIGAILNGDTLKGALKMFSRDPIT